MYIELAKKLKPYTYVVQRNWRNLPLTCKYGTHEDLDLFVSLEDKDALLDITKDYPEIDVRFPGDGYYPLYICDLLLQERREYKGFWIPSPEAAFLSLYYHNRVHKLDNPYQEELVKLFDIWMPPERCIDQGVGYYGG